MASIPPVVLKASSRHTATMIFLHGLGDTGFGWAGALNTIRPKYMKVVCPTANSIPITCNGGMSMPAWYDILDISNIGQKREDLDGVRISSENLDNLIENEEKEVHRNRIILGGFSQGGALALHTILRNKNRPLAGCVALSCYLPGNQDPQTTGTNETPILQIHGDQDDIVPISKGIEASDYLKTISSKHVFKSISGMGHEGTVDEMELVRQFIQERVPELPF